MATRKNRPVLYELAGLGSRQRESSRRYARPAPPSEPPTSEGPPIPVHIPAAQRPSRPRGIRVVAGRLYVELGWPGLSVAAVGLVLVLWVTFQAGTRYARTQPPPSIPGNIDDPAGNPDAESSTTTAGRITPEHRLSEGQSVVTPAPSTGERRAEPAPAPSRQPESPAADVFRKGSHYVVIQHFRRTQKDAAMQAGSFLIANGINCVVVPGKDFRLIATEPFLLRQPDANARTAAERRCQELKNRIKSLGRQYAKDHGYAFEQCYELVIRR